MSLSLFAAFWAVSALFIITPGADWAYTISAGIRGRVVIPAVAGLLSGHLIATLVVAAGVGAFVTSEPSVMTAITVAGAGYLLWLGSVMMRHPSVPSAGNVDEGESGLQWALKGLCISGFNPKVFLLFLALLPQFTDPEGSWPLPAQMFVLGLIHVCSSGIVYLLVGYGSRAVLKTHPRAALLVSWISGALMIIIAALLLVERFS